jgi:hypothetical protein
LLSAAVGAAGAAAAWMAGTASAAIKVAMVAILRRVVRMLFSGAGMFVAAWGALCCHDR